jgi:hypothetical protein
MMTCPPVLPATQTVVTSWSNICHTLMEANADWWIPPEQQQRLVASVVDHDVNSNHHRDSQIESLPHETSPTRTVTEFNETNDNTAEVNHNNNNYMVIMGKENMTRRRLNLTKVTGNVVVAAAPMTLPGVATTASTCANNSQHTRSLLLSMEEDEKSLVEEVDDFSTATEDNQDDDVGPKKNRCAAADDDSVSLF